MRSDRIVLIVPLLLTILFGAPLKCLEAATRADLPERLTDREFWKLIEDISEPDGSFRSDNLLSNEMVFARLLPDLLPRTKAGGVYMGVGPEQNFTYIASMKSKLAFITDIRRENLHLQLMYKAVFELSRDRAEFISLLFTKPRPAGLSTGSTITDIMNAYWDVVTADEAAYTANLQKIQNHLTKTHALPLPQADIDGVANVYRAFYIYGPSMNYSASLSLTTIGGGNAATYRDLMTQSDASGQHLTFLGSEEKFAYMKDLESKNLIVPVVGNFSGPKAIRAIGAYVNSRGATVAAFYVSTVEPYLKRDGSFPAFCANVATLPMNEQSVFIRPGNIGALQSSGFAVAPADANTPRIGSYQIGVIVPMTTGCN
jgi:hypothetical protein